MRIPTGFLIRKTGRAGNQVGEYGLRRDRLPSSSILIVLFLVALYSGKVQGESACTLTQITKSTADHFHASINGDGTRVVFHSKGDLTGANPTTATSYFFLKRTRIPSNK
jgi:hypothetical protein